MYSLARSIYTTSPYHWGLRMDYSSGVFFFSSKVDNVSLQIVLLLYAAIDMLFLFLFGGAEFLLCFASAQFSSTCYSPYLTLRHQLIDIFRQRHRGSMI